MNTLSLSDALTSLVLSFVFIAWSVKAGAKIHVLRKYSVNARGIPVQMVNSFSGIISFDYFICT